MKRRFARLLATATLTMALGAGICTASASAEYGFSEFDVTFNGEDGSPAMQAGAHPFALTTSVELNSTFDPKLGDDLPDADPKDVTLAATPGLIGSPTATPRCATADFSANPPTCSLDTVIGTSTSRLSGPLVGDDPVFNLIPPPGYALKFGFWAVGNEPVVVLVTLNADPPHNVIAKIQNVVQAFPVLSSRVTLWGVPADPAHDAQRGGPVAIAPQPFLTSPRACLGPLTTEYATDSWESPGASLPDGRPDLTDPSWLTGSALTHDDAIPPSPQGFTGCGRLNFDPSISAQPTTRASSSPTGLDFSLDVNDEGITSPTGIADSDIRKAVVTLPEGMSANPSLAEGLEVCSEADLARETAFSDPGAGCPNGSKIGSLEVETPLLEDQIVKGSLFVAKPYQNPFGSLLAMYLVIQDPGLGISIKQPLKIEPDPLTGQLTTTAEELPQLPFSHFRLHFREGVRSPLVSPPACGAHDVTATLYPYSGGPPVTTTSAFEIISGPDSSPCPTGGLPPFRPGLVAGSINNAAGRFSPFNIRLSRNDSEQEITHFSIKLPPGVVAKLAGVPFCPDAAIAAAKERTGPLGGHEELASPSCPKASEIGHTLVGGGVGPALAYAPGKLYLAGPYHGSAISIVAITAGVVGPFDIGNVVVRQALRVNPETGEVFIDATGSDPIPHIIQGIPVHLRDIRAYTDRPQFVLNPTDCTRTSTASTLLGAGLDFVSEADDNPVTVSTPFQAADCAALPFEPKLSLRLIGGTHRGSHPKLVSHLAMNGIGEAGVGFAQVTLPRSEFIENAHFDTICTKVQFARGTVPGEQCPAGSIYGRAKAVTPILDEPLEGPVFLRSNPERELPDVVAALHSGKIDVVLDGHVDSVKGQIRTTFESVPDAPVSSFDLELAGQSKGLFVNSTDLCKGAHRAIVDLTGQNGKAANLRPKLGARCPKAKKHKRAKRHERRHRAD